MQFGLGSLGDLLGILAAQALVWVGNEPGQDVSGLLRLEQFALGVHLDKVVVGSLVHAAACLGSDEGLHVGVDTARRDGDACDIRLLDRQLLRNGVDGGLGRSVGGPRLVRLDASAGGDPDNATLGLS